MTIIMLKDCPYQIVYVSFDIVYTMHVHIINYSVIDVTEQNKDKKWYIFTVNAPTRR